MDHRKQRKSKTQLSFRSSRLSTLGVAGCIGLAGLVATTLLCPTSLEANAAEIQTNVSVATQLSVAMAPSVDINLNPNENNGYAEGSTQLTVSTNNPTGYKIFIYTADGSQTLKHINDPQITINPIVGEVTSAEFSTNTWGYNLNHGTTPGTNFNAVPGTLSDSQTVEEIAKDDTWTLTFGAKVADTLPAGQYTNAVIVSAVANATTASNLTQLTYMQDMTHDICENSQIGDTKQLMDKRDNKTYWVTKLADNNCWMTQNLALDITTAGLSSEMSDLGWNKSNSNDGSGGGYPTTIKYWNSSSGYRAPRNTEKTITTSTENDPYNTRSWDFSGGPYYEIMHDGSIGCGQVSDISVCVEDKGIIGTEPTLEDISALGQAGANHYAIGNYYQWNAATAGTGGQTTTGEANDSICPRNWKLPTSGNDKNSGSFTYLLKQYGLSESATGTGFGSNIITAGNNYNIAEAPLFFIRGGYIDLAFRPPSFNNAVVFGQYWSSTPKTDETTDGAYALWLQSTSIDVAKVFNRRYGNSVRCLAR